MAKGLTFKSRLLSRGAYRALAQLRNLGEDPRALLDLWGGILEASTRNRFDTSRGPGGVPWPYSKRVLRVGNHGPANGRTLVDKGNLERAVTYEVRGRGRLLVGVDGVAQSVKVARVHQFGVNKDVTVKAHTRVIDQAFGVPLAKTVTVKVRSHTMKMRIPARPFLGVDNEDRRELRDASNEYVRGLLK